MDIFDQRAAKLMLIASESIPFDSGEFHFELRLGGQRCLAYLGNDATELRDAANRALLPRFPELSGLHRQVGPRCIIDGEIVAGTGGRDHLPLLRKRTLARSPAAVAALSREIPCIFVARDILYRDGRRLTALPLAERRTLLQAAVGDSERLCPVRGVDERGIDFYNLVRARGLGGIIAKRKDSPYRMGEKTRDWIEIGDGRSADFVVCGFVPAEGAAGACLVLGQYAADGSLVHKGRVPIPEDRGEFDIIERQPRAVRHPFAGEPGAGDAVWLEPRLVCTVGFARAWTAPGTRRPFFMGLRLDKLPYAASESA